MRRFLFASFLFLCSCYRVSSSIEPQIPQPCHPKEIAYENKVVINLPAQFSVSPFTPLTAEEAATDWGKEYKIGLLFASDFDLYRAISSFKRALFLFPEAHRRKEIEYCIALSYYLGKKYEDVIFAVESTDLIAVDTTFPSFKDLLLILYDSYEQTGSEVKKEHIFALILQTDSEVAEKLSLLDAITSADFATLDCFAKKKASIENLLICYETEAKSVKKAQILNAIIPGAGYWYVGQKETAITAFLVNSLFIGAAIAFFDHGNGPAALLTLSFESGWYFGGIHGAGLAAKYYNECLYERSVEKMAEKEKLFPLMLLRYSF